MRALRIADSRRVVLELLGEIRRSALSRYHHRLHAVLLVAQGLTCPEVARLLGDSPRAVQYWIHRFQARALAGLREDTRPGRPARLSQAQLQTLSAALRLPPPHSGLEGLRWDGKLLSALLKNQFGLTLGVRQCQRLFRRLGVRPPELHLPAAHPDPAAQPAPEESATAQPRPKH